jgi:hypothetical protein
LFTGYLVWIRIQAAENIDSFTEGFGTWIFYWGEAKRGRKKGLEPGAAIEQAPEADGKDKVPEQGMVNAGKKESPSVDRSGQRENSP